MAPAHAEAFAQTICAKAAKNAAVFELLPLDQTASAGSQPGSVRCRWTFGRPSTTTPEIVVELTSETLSSETIARFAIVAARLPENRRGRALEGLPSLADGGNSFTTVEAGVLRLVEIEAVKGRRRFELTVRPGGSDGLNYRVPGQSANFFGAALKQL